MPENEREQLVQEIRNLRGRLESGDIVSAWSPNFADMSPDEEDSFYEAMDNARSTLAALERRLYQIDHPGEQLEDEFDEERSGGR